MSQIGQGGGGTRQQHGDTTYTKIFVGGLAWETHRETMGRYFEQFGEIEEAVVITDKHTGRSKGYGFVTFKDPDAAMRACQDPSPVIDGRRANCNLASLGANRSRLPNSQQGVRPRRVTSGIPAPFLPSASSSYFSSTSQQYPWNSSYPQEHFYPMSYYNAYGGTPFSSLYPAAAAGMPGSPYPYYTQYPHGSQGQANGYGMQYLMSYPYMPQYYSAHGLVSLPSCTPTGGAAFMGFPGSGSATQSPKRYGQKEQKTSLGEA